MKMVLRPDCADLPYFLRAYFAFKMAAVRLFEMLARRRRQGAALPAVVQHPERRCRAFGAAPKASCRRRARTRR